MTHTRFNAGTHEHRLLGFNTAPNGQPEGVPMQTEKELLKLNIKSPEQAAEEATKRVEQADAVTKQAKNSLPNYTIVSPKKGTDEKQSAAGKNDPEAKGAQKDTEPKTNQERLDKQLADAQEKLKKAEKPMDKFLAVMQMIGTLMEYGKRAMDNTLDQPIKVAASEGKPDDKKSSPEAAAGVKGEQQKLDDKQNQTDAISKETQDKLTDLDKKIMEKEDQLALAKQSWGEKTNNGMRQIYLLQEGSIRILEKEINDLKAERARLRAGNKETVLNLNDLNGLKKFIETKKDEFFAALPDAVRKGLSQKRVEVFITKDNEVSIRCVDVQPDLVEQLKQLLPQQNKLRIEAKNGAYSIEIGGKDVPSLVQQLQVPKPLRNRIGS